MKKLSDVIGRETDCDELARKLQFFVKGFSATAVGGYLVTCSDESERECADAFQRYFSDALLPPLKFGQRAHFRTANLGGRYEWGGVRVAEDHYSTPATETGFKLILVKINSHVSLEELRDGRMFGRMGRYDRESVYCAALHAVLDGKVTPFTRDLREAINSEGKDRIAILLDDAQVDPAIRSLAVAILSARLQARRALVEIQDSALTSPTLFYVLPCVTLNRTGRDTEIVCGAYEADYRDDEAKISYRGLGDDPSKYQVFDDLAHLSVRDDQIETTRTARDHRKLALNELTTRIPDAKQLLARKIPRDLEGLPAELHQTLGELREKKHENLGHSKRILKAFLRVLAHLDPTTSAVLCFGEGLAAIHHIHRIERLSREVADDEDARQVLEDVHHGIDSLPPERARELVDLLAHDYGK